MFIRLPLYDCVLSAVIATLETATDPRRAGARRHLHRAGRCRNTPAGSAPNARSGKKTFEISSNIFSKLSAIFARINIEVTGGQGRRQCGRRARPGIPGFAREYIYRSAATAQREERDAHT